MAIWLAFNRGKILVDDNAIRANHNFQVLPNLQNWEISLITAADIRWLLVVGKVLSPASFCSICGAPYSYLASVLFKILQLVYIFHGQYFCKLIFVKISNWALLGYYYLNLDPKVSVFFLEILQCVCKVPLTLSIVAT